MASAQSTSLTSINHHIVINMSQSTRYSGDECFALRISIPYANCAEGRKEFRIDFANEQMFKSMISSLTSEAAAKQTTKHDPMKKKLVGLCKSVWSPSPCTDRFGDELQDDDEAFGNESIEKARQNTLEILEGKRPQPTMRDYSPKYEPVFKNIAKFEVEMAELTARGTRAPQTNPRRPTIDMSPAWSWVHLHRVILDQISEADRGLFPAWKSDVKPLLLYLQEGEDLRVPGLETVKRARNLSATSVFEFTMLMGEVAHKGWENHILWLELPERDPPTVIDGWRGWNQDLEVMYWGQNMI